MITFNELRFTDNKDSIVINCSAETGSISHIDIVNRKDFSENTDYSGSQPEYSYRIPVGSSTYNSTIPVAYLQPTVVSSDLNGELLYVIVSKSGSSEIGVVLDWQLLYSYVLGLLAAYYKKCNQCVIPDALEDAILLWNAIKVCIATCDWTLLSKLWDKFTMSGISSLPCGCNQGN